MDENEGHALPEGLDKLGQGIYHSYDIYVKDMPRSGGFFKHAQTFRMFPVQEPRVRVDDYGEMIDVGAYMKEEEQTAIEAAATGEEIPQPVCLT